MLLPDDAAKLTSLPLKIREKPAQEIINYFIDFVKASAPVSLFRTKLKFVGDEKFWLQSLKAHVNFYPKKNWGLFPKPIVIDSKLAACDLTDPANQIMRGKVDSEIVFGCVFSRFADLSHFLLFLLIFEDLNSE